MAKKEYIEREAAIDACFDGWDNNAHDCAENIRSIPAADVRPVVRGKWKKAPCHETDEAYTYICPFCRWYMIAIEPMNFCPNCGARMEES